MAPDLAGDGVEYWLDEGDVIVGVNEGFRLHAEANGAPGLAGRVVGTSIWDHLRGYEVQEIYRAIFEDVRQADSVSGFKLRCDGPGTRINMQMELRPVEGGGLHIRSTTLTAEPSEEAIPMMEAAVPGQLVRGCSFCSRINSPPWMPARQAAEDLHLMVSGTLRISHGVCPECHERIMGDVQVGLGGTETL